MQQQVDAQIAYLRPTSLVNRRYWAPGAEANTGVYDPYPVVVRNARLAEKPFTLDEHGFAIARFPTKLSNAEFEDKARIEQVYHQEVKDTVMAMCGADHVALMGGQIRSSGATGAIVQPPAAEAHVDFNTPTSNKLAKMLYDKTAPNGPGYDRFILFSLWRVLSDPPQDWPLALCDYSSVDDSEGLSNVKVDVDAIPPKEEWFKPIPGEEDMVAASIFHHSPNHRWWYFPDMTRDEVVFIKFHDSDHSRAWRALHTAFHDKSQKGAKERRSFEFRGIAYFSRKG
ncbi:MAG: CmcJ/NvfI family oxidoreductase [Parvularculaceae bacterium]